MRVQQGEKGVGSNGMSLFLKEFVPLNSLSWKVLVLQLPKRSATTVFEVHGSYWYQMKQILVLYKLMKSFFRFSNLKKNYNLQKFKFSTKNRVFWKKLDNSKINTKFKKSFSLVCRPLKSASIDINIDSVGQSVCLLNYLPRTPFFHVFCE